MKLRDFRNSAAREGGGEHSEVRQETHNKGACFRAVALYERVDEIQGNHRENKQSQEDLAGPAPGQQFFQPRANQSFNRHIEQHEHGDDQNHGRQNARFSYGRSKGHGQKPADRRNRGKIGEPIGQTDDVKGAETQRKSQERPKLEARAKPGNKNREDLAEKKNAPKEQGHPARPALLKKEIST